MRRNHRGSRNPNWREGVTFKKCSNCGKSFKGARKEKFCSVECWKNSRRKTLRCLTCGKPFIVPKSWRRKYCSLACAYKSPSRSSKTRFTSERVKKLWQDKEFREKTIRASLKGLFKRPTSLEKKFMRLVEKHNLPFIYCGNGSILIGWKNPDFCESNGKKICIEVASTYWHSNDWAEKRINHFARYGWDCLVFFDSDLDDEVRVVEGIKCRLT